MDDQATAERKLESDLFSQFGALQTKRRPWESGWDRVTDYIYPRRSVWNLDLTSSSKVIIGKKIYDGTAIAALNLMSDGVQGKLIPAAMPFFKLRFKNRVLEEVDGARPWLEQVELAMYAVLNASNFHDAMAEIFPDAIAIGTAYLYIEAIKDEGIIFQPRHYKEMYVSENRFGRVDTFYRHFSMTLRQAVEEFGNDLPEDLRTDLDTSPERPIELLHCVRPRKTWSPDPEGRELPAMRKRFGSYYLLYRASGKEGKSDARTKSLIRESGFDEFPLVVWRMRKNPGEEYGRGPGLDAIYDVEMLNLAMKGLQEAGHRALLPPTVVSEGFRGRIRTNPGGMTYWDGLGEPVVKPLMQMGQSPFTIEVINRLTNNVREHFHADFFQLLAMQRDQLMNQGPKGPKTATEIDAITAETASVMSTMVSRNQTELLSPVLALVYLGARRLGLLPTAPSELKQYSDEELEPEYVGPLAMAQRRFLTFQSTYEAGAAVINLATAKNDMSLLLNFDWDDIIRGVGDSKGLPAKDLFPLTKVKQLKQEAAEQQMKMLQLQIQLESLKSGQLAKAPEPGSPMAQQGVA